MKEKIKHLECMLNPLHKGRGDYIGCVVCNGIYREIKQLQNKVERSGGRKCITCGGKGVWKNEKCANCGYIGTETKPILQPEITTLKLFFNKDDDCYEINNMRHSDSRIDLLAEKLNEVIDQLNILTKTK